MTTAPALRPPVIEIVDVDASSERLAIARELFGEYAAGLGIDLAFQDFEREKSTLPGVYAAPAGALLLAFVDGHPAGCGALRPRHDTDYPNACEMKRLYVRDAYRRLGLGRLLAEGLIERALRGGYATLLLDTLDDMEAARGLYRALGFEEIPPYYFNPLPGAHYLKCELDASPTGW